MSIWSSWPTIGYGDPDEPERGEVRSYAEGWSNHYPDDKVELPASAGVAHVAPWCVPGWDDHTGDDCSVGPWLRLDIDTAEHSFPAGGEPTGKRVNAAVVMDEAAVRALRDDLTEWLEAKKVRPR